MKIIIMLTFCLLILSLGNLSAQGVRVTTPEGTFDMQISADSYDAAGNTNSGAIIENIASKLEELERDYVSKLQRLDKARAEKLINEIFALLVLLPTDTTVNLEKGTTGSSQAIPGISINVGITEQSTIEQQTKLVESEKPAAEPARNPMPDADFRRLLNNIRGESFSDDQLRVIRLACRDSWFTCDQISQVVGVLSFSDDQLEALQAMYPRVTDPHNSHNIINAFTFSDDKEEAERIMAR